jgi:hypothetical protein
MNETIVSKNSATTRLSGTRLILARIAWIIVVSLSLAVTIADIPLEFRHLHMVCVGASCGQQLTAGIVQELHHLNLSVDFFATYLVVLKFGFVFVWVAVALLIFWRRSDDRMALLVALFLVLFPAAQGIGSPDAVGAAYPSLRAPMAFLDTLGWLSLLLFFFLFPDGRFVPRWTLGIVFVYALANIPGSLFPAPPHGTILETITFLIGFPLLIVVVGIGLFSQIYRYRRVSNPVQRQQTKWVVYGIVAAVILFTGFVTIGHFFFSRPALFPVLLSNTVIYGIELLIPLSIGFSALHYRLYDIDVLINRTLVYGTLTSMLALLYFGLIFALQSLLGGIINSNNGVAIVISTLVIAALFQPLHRRIQTIIDHRFYRRKYDAARTLAAFSATLRNEVDLSQLSEHLLGVVQETMQPAHISLWLHSPAPSRQQNIRLLPHIEEKER